MGKMWSCEFQPKDVPGWTCCSCIYIYIWVNYNEVPEDLLDDQVEDVKSPMMTVVELVMSQVYRISKIDIVTSRRPGDFPEIAHKKIMDEFATGTTT
jgi:hypothetical protein